MTRTAQGEGLLAGFKADPDTVSLAEIRKLQAVRTLGLPADLSADVSENWLPVRARAGEDVPVGLPGSPGFPVPGYTAGGAVLVAPGGDHRCAGRAVDWPDPQDNARVEKEVERELTADLRRVRGKEGLLFRMAEAALEQPDETVRGRVVPGGGRSP